MTLATQLRDDFRSVMGHIHQQVAHLESAERLLRLGEVRRTERSTSAPIEVLEITPFHDAQGCGVRGRVQGVHAIYEVRVCSSVPIGTHRVYHCSCLDSVQRGRAVGPCKHTLALAKVWHEQLMCELMPIADALGPMMPSRWKAQLASHVTTQIPFSFEVRA